MGLNKGSLVDVYTMEGPADDKTGVDMLLTLRIAPLLLGNTEWKAKHRQVKIKKKTNSLFTRF